MLQALPRKLLMLFALVGAALLVSFSPTLAQEYEDGGDVEDVSVFYEELRDYGHWERHPEWGYVWIPDDVDEDWRPYTQGYWSYTDDYGWYWESDEPFAWAVYHYGRWGYDEEFGWFWVPGTKWAPAWVVWRHSDDYIGWTALPPDAIWSDEGDIIFGSGFYDSPRYVSLWVFAPPIYLTTPGLHLHIHNWRHNRDVFFRTRPITRYGYRDRRVFNRGIERREFERLTHRRIESKRLHFGAERGRGGAQGTVNVFRPRGLKRPEKGFDPRTLRSTKRPDDAPRFGREGGGRRGPNLLAPEGGQSGVRPGPKPGAPGKEGWGISKGDGKGFDKGYGSDKGPGKDFGKGPSKSFEKGGPSQDAGGRKGGNQPLTQQPPGGGGQQPAFRPGQGQQQQPKQFNQKQFDQKQFNQKQLNQQGQQGQSGPGQPRVLNRQGGGIQQGGPGGPGAGRQDGERRGGGGGGGGGSHRDRDRDKDDRQRQ